VRSPHLRWVALVAAIGALALPASAFAVAQITEQDDGLRDHDARSGAVAPTGAQRAAVKRLRAAVTWNQFGTPATLSKRGKYLAKGVRGKTASAAARRWLHRNRALFRLASTAGLEVVRDSRLPFSRGHAVHFRQVFGGLETVDGGMVTIGLTGSARKGWNIAFASSSLTSDTAVDGRARLSAIQGFAAASRGAGAGYSVTQVRGAKTTAGGWTQLRVRAAGSIQRVRAVAFPTVRSGVIPAYESYVSKGDDAYRVVVDGRNGALLTRQSTIFNAAEGFAAVNTIPLSGEVPGTEAACGPDHSFTVGAGVRYLDGYAIAAHPLNDMVLLLIKDGTTLISADSNFSPERFHYEPAGGVPAGTYVVRICDFDDPNSNDGWFDPRTYTGRVIVDDTVAPAPYLARWNAFPSSPLLGPGGGDPWGRVGTDIRKTYCWRNAAGCDVEAGNLASRYPWDHDPNTDTPTFTTIGNNAVAAESWTHETAPAPFQFRPVSPTRDYSFPWTDSWRASDCNTGNPSGSAFVPGVSFDISAAVTNLFVSHNRMHDWSYYLGFTEQNWNAQQHNFGLTEAFRQNDPVTGDAQAGAALPTPEAFVKGSRNNANMGTAIDGSSSVTNMYLWQPQQGVYYGPCADGDYDLPLIGHEYGHMIENRMIGKGAPRQGHQAGAMGEAHGDLFGMEIVNEEGLVPVDGENRYAVSVYATGQKLRGIRNYGMNFPQTGAFPTVGKYVQVDPLNFSDLGYDVTGPTTVSTSQVHANGEIWSATNFRIRKLLAKKYNRDFPYDDVELQQACAAGEYPPQACPGNRRWMQLVFDAMLLMPTAPTMLQARDAALAADLMRFGGANQKELWLAYARSGMGRNAFTGNNTVLLENDTDPVPDFESPLHENATIRFVARANDGGTVPARIFVGHYEARVSPIADTDPATPAAGTPAAVVNLDDTAKFAPGTYEFVATAPGYGHLRFRKTLYGGKQSTLELRFATNYASSAKGATAAGDTSGADAAAQATQLRNLIDDTERTHWTTAGVVDGAGNLSVDGKRVTVDLAGSEPVNVKRVNVSSLVFSGQNRFTALRSFELWACNAKKDDCSTDAGFDKVYSSPANAFPGDAPRPIAPIMLLREFDVSNTKATHLRLVVKTNQCTGGSQFQGDQDADPMNNPDCDLNPTAAVRFVRAAELQAFGDSGSVHSSRH
jgi:extracellular elastinolytic metalloproteinase